MANSNKGGQETPAAEVVNDKAIVKRPPAPEVVNKPKRGRKPKAEQRDSMLSIVGTVTTADLKQALDIQTEQRQLIKEFINKHLAEGTDYGKIHVVKNCFKEEKQRGSCDIEYHYSKPILFKPGQEKIFSLFGITDKLEKDLDAYDMLPDVKGLVAYKCTMYQRDKIIGEGRGAATLTSERSDPNATIKKAQKRARMDACLSLGFSEYFTQDLDDPEYASQREIANSKAAAEAERRDRDEFGLMPRDPEAAIDNSERVVLHKMLLAAGFSDSDEIKNLFIANGIPEPTALTSAQARQMMGKLKNATFAAPEPKAPENGPDDSQAGPTARTAGPDPELVVDDELKAKTEELVSTLGLNAQGNMWFMRKVCGKPFGNFEKLTDEEWRRAYNLVQDILDRAVEVDEHHIAGVIHDDEEPSQEPTQIPFMETEESGDKAVTANG